MAIRTHSEKSYEQKWLEAERRLTILGLFPTQNNNRQVQIVVGGDKPAGQHTKTKVDFNKVQTLIPA